MESERELMQKPLRLASFSHFWWNQAKKVGMMVLITNAGNSARSLLVELLDEKHRSAFSGREADDHDD